jgi:DNA (cytosine-5)-methyltransferase 1
MFADEMIVDSFAGGGGASTGIELALGVAPDIAINHDADALKMHAANHPETLHVREDVWAASLTELVRSGGRPRPVGLLWASPDCKHFSRAKGSKPVNKNIRSLAWIVVKWASQVRPRVIILENVREFADWGPLVPQWTCKCGWNGTEGQATLKRTRRRCPRCESPRIKPTLDMVPDPDKKGMTFRLFCNRLRGMGYKVEWRNLNAADYGAPTHRRRLFLIARRDGAPIEWPAPTHGDPKKLDDAPLFERLAPWRTAAECIDWALPCPSIFDRKKPLAEKTLRRIALGIKRYVLDNPRPFIVPITHHGERRSHDIDQPAPTVTTSHRGEHALVEPRFARATADEVDASLDAYRILHGQDPITKEDLGPPLAVCKCGFAMWATHKECPCCLAAGPFITGVGGRMGQTPPASVEEPSNTITAKNDRAIVTPILVSTAHTGTTGRGRYQDPVDAPAKTATQSNDKAIVTPYLVPRYGERDGQEPRTQPVTDPMPTVVPTANAGRIVTPILVGAGGSEYAGKPRSVEAPFPTTKCDDRRALVAASIVKHFGGVVGAAANEPLPTTLTSGAQNQLLAANLVRMNHGEKQWNSVDEPTPAVMSQSNKLGLVASNLVRFNHDDAGLPLDAPTPTLTTNNRAALVYAFLVKYFGTAIGVQVEEPAPTATGKDRFGLVTVTIEGEPYVIADIGMRMLTPRELARAQGFPDGYVLTGTKTSQVAKIGNSVCPPVAAALVRANVVQEAAA